MGFSKFLYSLFSEKTPDISSVLEQDPTLEKCRIYFDYVAPTPQYRFIPSIVQGVILDPRSYAHAIPLLIKYAQQPTVKVHPEVGKALRTYVPSEVLFFFTDLNTLTDVNKDQVLFAISQFFFHNLNMHTTDSCFSFGSSESLAQWKYSVCLMEMNNTRMKNCLLYMENTVKYAAILSFPVEWLKYVPMSEFEQMFNDRYCFENALTLYEQVLPFVFTDLEQECMRRCTLPKEQKKAQKILQYIERNNFRLY